MYEQSSNKNNKKIGLNDKSIDCCFKYPVSFFTQYCMSNQLISVKFIKARLNDKLHVIDCCVKCLVSFLCFSDYYINHELTQDIEII